MELSGLFWLTYIFPNFSFSVCMLEIYMPGKALTLLNVNPKMALLAQVLTIPIYLALYIYLDEVTPNTYGVRKTLCFCCQRKTQKVD